MAAKPLLISGLRKTIGTGRDTRVWSEPWVPDEMARPPSPADHIVYKLPQLLVQSFIRNDTKEWDTQLLREFFHPDDIPLILGLKPSRSHFPDGYVWNHTKSGVYSVKTGYDLLQSIKLNLSHEDVIEPSITGLQSHVWKLKAPSKMKHFLWQAITGCVATARNDKLFNGKDVSPIDTLRHATLEAECWRKANEQEEANEDQDVPHASEIETVPPWMPQIPTCQIDAS
ncbi:uncharacterized protein LOC106355351 [Brassica napus]|uniref:uncharacterized protein LOC106355351 n=1 Tax=Brassica napus TaxID=3708 RepID=UPI0006AB17DC|nr:uncharacterized protein LOC106355351 [Brassica napus]